MRRLFEAAGALHQLHVLDVPDVICLARLHERNAEGRHPYHVSDDDFAELTSYFEMPTSSERFDIIVHR